MAQRISRAKRTIKSSGVPLELPNRDDRGQKLGAVLHVLYLIFNEGYTSTAGPHLHRIELSSEAIRLARLVCALMPEDPEASGLLALMLLTDARRRARTGRDGELIPLSKQNRGLWDQAQIAEGVALLTTALSRGSVGVYQLQAAIAAVHDEAACPKETDWPQILALYDLLNHMSDNPMVTLNHAIAAGMVHGPQKGLDLLEALEHDERISGHHRLHAARAHLFEMAGDYATAVEHYRMGASRTTNMPERDYLLRQAARISDVISGGIQKPSC